MKPISHDQLARVLGGNAAAAAPAAGAAAGAGAAGGGGGGLFETALGAAPGILGGVASLISAIKMPKGGGGGGQPAAQPAGPAQADPSAVAARAPSGGGGRGINISITYS